MCFLKFYVSTTQRHFLHETGSLCSSFSAQKSSSALSVGTPGFASFAGFPQKRRILLLMTAYIRGRAWVTPRERWPEKTLPIYFKVRSDCWSPLGPCRIPALGTKADLRVSQEDHARQETAPIWPTKAEVPLRGATAHLLRDTCVSVLDWMWDSGQKRED